MTEKTMKNNEKIIQDEKPTIARRWYDKDPVLSKAMRTLQESNDKIQIQVALNLIKVVIEHKIEENELTTVNDLVSTVNDASNYDSGKNSRWYDLNETVRAAILMLQNCPDKLQKKISTSMAEIVSLAIEADSE